MKEIGAKFIFVSNELGNFRHHREHLVRAVQAMGWSPVLFAAPVGKQDGLDYDYRPLPIERFRFHPALDLRMFVTIFRLLLEEQPRGIHLINIKPYLFGGLAAQTARLFGWRGSVVITVPGLGRLYDQGGKSPAAKIRRALVERLLRVATHHAHVTFETAQDRAFWIARGLIAPDQAVVTCGTGIDFANFVQKSHRPVGERLKVLFAGRLLRAKGLDIFLKAAAMTNDTDIEMLVAGPAESDPDAVPPKELQRVAQVRYLGPVGDMPALLKETDIVVLPSRYNEGVPRILIEAAASGCITIATRFAGSEMLIEDNRTGFFLDAGDADVQAAQLVRLIAKIKKEYLQYSTMGESAAIHVRTKGFSNREVADAFLGLYIHRDEQSEALH